MTVHGGKQEKRGERLERARKKRQQRMIIFAIIGLFGLALVAFAVYQALQPRTFAERYRVEGRTFGDPDAPVRIDVFSDFQCVACARFAKDVEVEIAENLAPGGQVYYVYRHFPFFGQESIDASLASMCAAEQELFWEYHDILVTNFPNRPNSGAYSRSRLASLAERVGLDMPAYTACMDENRYQDVIDEDILAGEALGVSGTPAVYVNGRAIVPGGSVPNYQAIRQAVERITGPSQ
jgi:protein-disulfide isomerase